MSFLDVLHSETFKNDEISDSEFSLTHCTSLAKSLDTLNHKIQYEQLFSVCCC